MFQNAQTIQRFNRNFSKNLGLKQESSLDILLVGQGRMLGDFECINNINNQFTLKCYSPDAQAYVLTKKDFERLRHDDETWKFIQQESEK